MGLMKVSEYSWPVGRVMHIYNLACALNQLDHHGWWTTPAFGLPAIQKTRTVVSRIGHFFFQEPTSHSCQFHRTTSGNMYTHILIHRYYHNRSSATLDFIAIW